MKKNDIDKNNEELLIKKKKEIVDVNVGREISSNKKTRVNSKKL